MICTACDSTTTLETVGHGWFYCATCSALTLVDAAGQVVKVIHAKPK